MSKILYWYSIIAGKFSIIYSLHALLERNGDFTKYVLLFNIIIITHPIKTNIQNIILINKKVIIIISYYRQSILI